MALLEFVKGANQGTRAELVGDRIVFGRNADCGVVLNAPAVSREHAVIRKINGRFYIEDLNSRNGTELNGPTNKIKVRTALKDGDQICICGNLMIYYDTIPKPKLPEHMKSDQEEDAEEKDNSTVEATIQSASSKQMLEAQPAERLAMLLEIGVELTQTMQTDDLLPKIVERLFQVFRQADRGFIILKEDNKLLAKVIRTRRPDDDDKTRFSRKIVNRCMESGQGILSEDASSDAQFDMSQSIADCKIRSMVVAPVLAQRRAGPRRHSARHAGPLQEILAGRSAALDGSGGAGRRRHRERPHARNARRTGRPQTRFGTRHAGAEELSAQEIPPGRRI